MDGFLGPTYAYVMPLKYSIKHENSLVRVSVTGSPDYLDLDRLWHDIVGHCKRHGCQKILGESRTEQWKNTDAYDHAAIFEAAGVTNDHRIAWVEQDPDASESIRLAQAVVNNRGFENARTFDNVADAKRWLDRTDSY